MWQLFKNIFNSFLIVRTHKWNTHTHIHRRSLQYIKQASHLLTPQMKMPSSPCCRADTCDQSNLGHHMIIFNSKVYCSWYTSSIDCANDIRKVYSFQHTTWNGTEKALLLRLLPAWKQTFYIFDALDIWNHHLSVSSMLTAFIMTSVGVEN